MKKRRNLTICSEQGIIFYYGELSEWSKVQHSKCCVPKRDPGFESLTLRQVESECKCVQTLFLSFNHDNLLILSEVEKKFYTRITLEHCQFTWKNQAIDSPFYYLLFFIYFHVIGMVSKPLLNQWFAQIPDRLVLANPRKGY